MTKRDAFEGKLHALNPHVRFDAGEGRLAATQRRGLLFYTIIVSFFPLAVFGDVAYWDPSKDYTGFRWMNGHYPMGWVYKGSVVADYIILTVTLLAFASLIFWGGLFVYRVLLNLIGRKRSKRDLIFAFFGFGCSVALTFFCAFVLGFRVVKDVNLAAGGVPNLEFYDTEKVRKKYDRYCLERYYSFFDDERKIYKFNAPLPRENAPREVVDAYNECYDRYCLKCYKRVISPTNLPRLRDEAPEIVKIAYDSYCLGFYEEFQDEDSEADLPMLRECANQKIKEAYDCYCLKFYNRPHRSTSRWIYQNTPVPRAGSEKRIVDEYELFKIKRENAKRVSPPQGKYTLYEVGGDSFSGENQVRDL